jgi:hypothetical protein
VSVCRSPFIGSATPRLHRQSDWRLCRQLNVEVGNAAAAPRFADTKQGSRTETGEMGTSNVVVHVALDMVLAPRQVRAERELEPYLLTSLEPVEAEI